MNYISPAGTELHSASVCSETWFPTIHQIWRHIPVDGESWELPAMLLNKLHSEFSKHSPVLQMHLDALSESSSELIPNFISFQGIHDCFNSAHHIVHEGVFRFLRDVAGCYQASFQVRNSKFWSPPSEQTLKIHEERVKRVLDRWVYDWEFKVGSAKNLFSRMRLERLACQPVIEVNSVAEFRGEDELEKLRAQQIKNRNAENPAFNEAFRRLKAFKGMRPNVTQICRDAAEKHGMKAGSIRAELYKCRSLWMHADDRK